MDHHNCHPNPHIIHHLRILTIPLAGQVGGQPLLRIPSLATVKSKLGVKSFHISKQFWRYLSFFSFSCCSRTFANSFFRYRASVSVIRISNMVVRPRSQNPWQLASPHSSVVAGGRGASAVGGDESGALVPAAFRTHRLTQRNILGSRSTRQGESAVPHKCLHSSATSLCRMCTNLPVLHDRACSTVILAPQPSQAAGISSGEWLYRRRTLSLHLSADRPVPFNRFGKTESHSPAAQFCLSLTRHGRFFLAAAVEKDLLALEPIP